MKVPRGRRIAPPAPAAPPSGLDAWGARLTRARDIGLVGFGGIYALGYFARALHAWEYNLGVLPGVEFQYFVAGLILLAPPFTVFALLYGVWRLILRIPSWEGREPARQKRVDALLSVAAYLGVALFVLATLDVTTRLLGRGASLLTWLGGLMLLGSILVAAIVNSTRDSLRPPSPASPAPKRSPTQRLLAAGGIVFGVLIYGYFWMLTGLLFIATVLLGVSRVLPVLPQELGGGAPRCAKFDIDPAQLSAPLAGVLFDPASADAKALGTTRAVDVFHIGGDVVLFKLREAPDRRATYEIKRGSLAAITWCVEPKK